MDGSGQFIRVAENDRRTVTITVDGVALTALDGDTLATALLVHGHRLRQSEFDDGPRAGFCLMGACQDCWVTLGNGRRVRACTTLVIDGMAIHTGNDL
ncbi:MAG: (2Fe-2S)-binding protein [Alphaproteobacteria bacterium]